MTILIPTDIGRHMLTAKEDGAFMVYICLKTRCSGKMRLNKTILQEIAVQIGCNYRTIKNNLKKLQNWDWIGYNDKSGIYFIRGWQRITEIEKIEHTEKSAALFETKDIQKLKGFLFAATIQKLIRFKRRKQAKAAHQIPRAKQPESCFYPFSIRYLSQILGLSVRSIFEMKQIATKEGFLEYKSNYIPTNYDIKSFRQLLKQDNPGEFYTIKNHRIFLRASDLVKSNVLVLNKRKKSKQCINPNIYYNNKNNLP